MTPKRLADAPSIDLCAHCGPYLRRPVGLEPSGLRDLLAPLGVLRVYAGRLEALWFENPHDANRLPMSLAPTGPGPEVVAAPVLDPSIPTWPEELDRLSAAGALPLVRLWPGYGRYALDKAGPLLDALAKRKVIAQVLVRLDDPRRQHPLARVPDASPTEVRDVARRHPTLKVLLSGASSPSLQSLSIGLPRTNNLWADVSQADAAESVLTLSKTPWADRLVLGTNAPIFVPDAAFARVLLDLDDPTAEKVLHGNAVSLFA